MLESVFEHESIRDVLREQGIHLDASVPIVIAWSDRASLLLRPEYACLWLAECSHIQLPCSLAAVKAVLDAQQNCSSPELLHLRTLVGQVKWGFKRLEDSVASHDSDAFERLFELRNFCRMHWPQMYEVQLDIIENMIDGNQQTSDIFEFLTCKFDEVAAYEIFRPFFHGAPRDIVNSALGACHALTQYALTGVKYMSKESCTLVANMLNADEWWRSLSRLLEDVNDSFEESGAKGEIADHVRNCVVGFQASVPSLLVFLEKFAAGCSPDREEIASAYEALDVFIKMIIEIESRYSVLRSELQVRFSNV